MNLAEQEIQVSQIVYEEKVKKTQLPYRYNRRVPGNLPINLENVFSLNCYCTP